MWQISDHGEFCCENCSACQDANPDGPIYIGDDMGCPDCCSRCDGCGEWFFNDQLTDGLCEECEECAAVPMAVIDRILARLDNSIAVCLKQREVWRQMLQTCDDHEKASQIAAKWQRSETAYHINVAIRDYIREEVERG